MRHYTLPVFTVLILLLTSLSGCIVLRQSAKYNFNDGIYATRVLGKERVYVMHVDEDTLAVMPVKQYKDSTAILTARRVNYTPMQRRIKENKMMQTFYKPSFDFDVMTIPLKYRPSTYGIPRQLMSTFNGALFAGYRLDAYKLKYKRTPLNVYKQDTRHMGYSAGVYAGLGSSVINPWVMKDPNFNLEYEGVTLAGGIAVNMAVDKIAFGLALGFDYLTDHNGPYWVYQGKPTLGVTLGLDLY